MKPPAIWFAYVTLAGMAYLGFTTIYWAFFDNSIPYKSQIVQIQNEAGQPQSVFHPGDVMYIYRSWCADRDTPITVGRYLRSENRKINIAIGTSAGMLQKGCWATHNLVQIPPYTPPTIYKYDTVVQWQNNAFHFGIAQLPPFTIEVVR